MATFVYIVEAPSASDLADGRTEGGSLRETLRLSGIPHEYRLAVNFAEFLRAFALDDPNNLLRRHMQAGNTPIVHLSMHGDQEGIQLTDGKIIDWATLKHVLTPLNRAIPSGALVTFSTCGGASSIRMSMSEDDSDKPFLGTIGSFEKVLWTDALVAFTAFYHNWFKGQPVHDCVERMKAASGHQGFVVYSGAEQKEAYRQHVQRHRLIEALSRPAPPSNQSNPLFGLLGPMSEATHPER